MLVGRNWIADKSRIKRFKKTKPQFTKPFLFGNGLEFDRWIDYTNGSARSNGKSEGDLIESPGYVIESLLRDWVFTERTLKIDTVNSTSSVIISGATYNTPLLSSVDDFYNGAIWWNHSTGWKTYISDYVGSSKTLTLGSADITGAMVAGDVVSITNIQGDNLIDVTTFDTIGNTTNGLRKDYKLARSISEFTNAREVISSICSDFLLFLFKSGGKYKLATLEAKATADGTFSNPLKENGAPKIFTYLTDLNSYYSDFIFAHSYNHGKGEFNYKMSCNAKGSTSGLGSTYETLCRTANEQYKKGTRLYEKEFENIYNGIDSLPTTTTTMHSIAKLLITFYTKLRLGVEYYGDFKNHITYEIGDQVKINYSGAIPTGLNNSAFFLITDKQIESVNGIPTVRFTLMETFTVMNSFGRLFSFFWTDHNGNNLTDHNGNKIEFRP